MVRSTFGKYSSTHNNHNNNQRNKNINRCSTHIWWRGCVAVRLRSSREKCARVYLTDLPTDGPSVVGCSYIVQFIWSLFIRRTMWNEMNATGIFFSRTFFGWCAECRWCRMMISGFIFVTDINDQCSFNAAFIFSTTVILSIHRWQMDGRLSNKWNCQPRRSWPITFQTVFFSYEL